MLSSGALWAQQAPNIVLQLQTSDTLVHKSVVNQIGNLKKEFPDQFSLRTAQNGDENITNSFITIDSTTYKLGDSKDKSANAAFHRREGAQNLFKQFEILFERSRDLSL